MASNESHISSKEEDFFTQFFSCIAECNYDRAKEFSDKEKDAVRSSPLTAWSQFVHFLSQLAIAEKNYASLNFLSQRFFGRRENPRPVYNTLLQELRKIEDFSSSTNDCATDPVLNCLLGHISGQLCQYITARTKMMNFYEQLSTHGVNKNQSYDDLTEILLSIIQEHSKGFHHPLLSPVKTIFTYECEVMNHLLQSQRHISVCNFLPALLNLHEAKVKLGAWGNLHNVQETKSLFSSSRQQTSPPLYQWMLNFSAALLAKFSFYFFDVLSAQAPQIGEFKSMLAKCSVDYYQKVVTFQRKCEATNISLVLDTNNASPPHQSMTYMHPSAPHEKLSGLESYPAFFSFPNALDKHRDIPDIVSLLVQGSDELNKPDKVFPFYDEFKLTTYFMCKVDPNVTFVVIFDGKRNEKDVIPFVQEFCAGLRFTKLYAALKSGQK